MKLKLSYFLPLALLLILPLGDDASALTFDGPIVLENPTPASFDGFGGGDGVALSDEYLVAGDPGDDVFGNDVGVVYVFDANSLSLKHTIQNPIISSDDRFGSPVSLFGTHILVGAPLDDSTGTDSGRAYLFDAVTGNLLLTFENPTPDGNDQFGSAVSVSDTRVVVGAFGDGDNFGAAAGIAYVFDIANCDDDTSNQSHPNYGIAGDGKCEFAIKLLDPGAHCCVQLGMSVDIFEDRVLVGHNPPFRYPAFIFDANTGNSVKELPNIDIASRFSFSSDLHGDKALIGAFGAVVRDGDSTGAAYLFDTTSGDLIHKFENPSDRLDSTFGLPLSLSDDFVLIGNYRDNAGALASGAAHLYDVQSGELINTFERPIPAIQAQFGRSVIVHDDTILIGDRLNESASVPSGSIFIYKIIPETNPPVINSISTLTEPVQIGTEVSVLADFTDIDVDDTHTASFDWGDGTTSAGTVTASVGSDSVQGSHTYATPGVYTITLTVTDQDDLSDTITATDFAVVYDPDGGFVTGGGWIDSPPDSCNTEETADGICDFDVTGKATFGFVSKYQNGATEPSGDTQFHFKAGNLKFKSSDYEWLTIVVSGAKAQYKGTGTINGQGDYGFMLTGFDAQLNDNDSHIEDKFRIKIWSNDGGSGVVYDNKMGTSDNAEDATAIGGGNIKIHKGN